MAQVVALLHPADAGNLGQVGQTPVCPKRNLLSWEGPDWVWFGVSSPLHSRSPARVSGALNILKSPTSLSTYLTLGVCLHLSQYPRPQPHSNFPLTSLPPTSFSLRAAHKDNATRKNFP